MVALRFDAFHLALRAHMERFEHDECVDFGGMQRRTLLPILRAGLERHWTAVPKGIRRQRFIEFTQIAKRVLGVRVASLAYPVEDFGSLEAMLVSVRGGGVDALASTHGSAS